MSPRCLGVCLFSFLFLETAKSVRFANRSNYSAQPSFLHYFLVLLPLLFILQYWILWVHSLYLLFFLGHLHVSELGEISSSLSLRFLSEPPNMQSSVKCFYRHFICNSDSMIFISLAYSRSHRYCSQLSLWAASIQCPPSSY